MSSNDLAARLRARDLSAAPSVLNLLESTHLDDRERAATLSSALSPRELGGEAEGHIIGITGPPGAGKSTLLSALIAHWRAHDATVAVLAVDPSSRRSGGSLLGDRDRRLRLGAAARERARKHFSWGPIISATLAAYGEASETMAA